MLRRTPKKHVVQGVDLCNRNAIIAECQRIDPNGVYTDELCHAEGYARLTWRAALGCLLDLHSEEHTGDNPESAEMRAEIRRHNIE